jgi:predicted nucleotidyltransferase
VLRDDFRPDSDIDVLVTFAPESRLSLLELMDVIEELKEMFGREVHLVERCTIEESHNPIRRKEILSTAKEIYRAAA